MFEPMLAKQYADFADKINWPVAVQPKLNGIRMTWQRRKARSRTGKPLQLPKEMLIELNALQPQKPLDGEIYVHGAPLEKIYGNAKRLVSLQQDLELEFHVFDVFHPTRPFSERYLDLIQISDTRHVKVVETIFANCYDAVEDILGNMVKAGYEGVIIRDLAAPYEQKRTCNLLKLKRWKFAKATIVDFIEGKGKCTNMLGAIVVKNDDWWSRIGTGFSEKQRKDIWAARAKLIGKRICIKYRERTSKGMPRHPSFSSLG